VNEKSQQFCPFRINYYIRFLETYFVQLVCNEIQKSDFLTIPFSFYGIELLEIVSQTEPFLIFNNFNNQFK